MTTARPNTPIQVIGSMFNLLRAGRPVDRSNRERAQLSCSAKATSVGPDVLSVSADNLVRRAARGDGGGSLNKSRYFFSDHERVLGVGSTTQSGTRQAHSDDSLSLYR